MTLNNSHSDLSCIDNATLHGDIYLRQCESAAVAQKKIQEKFALRGTVGVTFNEIKCEYDGTFGQYKLENGMYV